MIIEDQERPRYVVIAEHSEYEQSTSYFISLDKAKEKVQYWKEHNAEVYLAQIMETP